MLRKRQPEVSPIVERVVILEKDGVSADIVPVLEIDAERIATPDHNIPIEDVKEYITPEGRLFVLHAPEWYVQETKHLARVEMSHVISQMVNFQKPGAAKRDPGLFLKLLPWIAAALALVMFIMKK